MSPYGSATSVIGVLTIGRSAAMYSSVLVGLMNRVASLRANGQQADVPAGQVARASRSYGCWPEVVDVGPPRQDRRGRS